MTGEKEEPIAAAAIDGDDRADTVDQDNQYGALSDWRSTLPDELKRFAANLASPVDAVRMAAGLRQKLSRAIVPPGSDATPEEVADFRRRLGVPQGPDGYRIRYPDSMSRHLMEGPRAALDEEGFLKAMHAAGATQETVQAAVDWYADILIEAEREISAARAAELRTTSEVLQREWGDDFERNAELSRRSAAAYGGEELIGRLEQAGLGNDPIVIRAFYRIGREMAEDHILGDRALEGSRRALEERAQALRSRSDRWTNKQVDRELRDIMEQLHGTQPINPDG